MRRTAAVIALTLATASLAACGKSGGQATGSEGAAGAPASAPTALTDEQKHELVEHLPAPYNTGDLANGKKVFAICKSCHTTVQGGSDMTGPNLWGVFGRKAGTEGTFKYSDGLKAAGFTWDAARIDQWIANPRAVVPDTKMSFAGVKDAKDRTDLIAYLKTETSAPE
jgi:cytochrome c